MKKFWVVCLCLWLCGGPGSFSTSKNAHAFAPAVPVAGGLTAVELGILAVGTYVFLKAVCHDQSVQQATRLAIESMGANQEKVGAALRVWIATWQKTPSCSISNQQLAALTSSLPFVHYQNDLTRFFAKYNIPTTATQLLHFKNYQAFVTELKSHFSNSNFRNELFQIEQTYQDLLLFKEKAKPIAITQADSFTIQMENLKSCLSDPEAWKNLIATLGYLGVAPAYFVSAVVNSLMQVGVSTEDRIFISTTEF